MSENKEVTHTQGEWKSEIEGTNTGQWLVIYVDDPNVDGEKRELFSSETVRTAVGKRNTLKPTFRDCINADEIRANVALAKAAPDMLAAHREIVSLAEGWDEDGATGPKPPLSWESIARMAMDYAQDAIAKATVKKENR